MSLITKEINVSNNFLIVCKNCNKLVIRKKVEQNNYICYMCDKALYRPVNQIIKDISDNDTFEELFVVNEIKNPINFEGYEIKQQELRKKIEANDAVTTGKCKINNIETCLGVMNSKFIMGSMGSIVGEKITKLFEYALDQKMPVILYTTSGGARMQEGIISLMQMVKTTQAIKKHSEAGLFYMPIITDPTTGGVTASFAQLGDIIIAEPNSLICFAGPRVIKKTINQELPEGFQRSEFLLKHGFLDDIVSRAEQKSYITRILQWVRK